VRDGDPLPRRLAARDDTGRRHGRSPPSMAARRAARCLAALRAGAQPSAHAR
jgi:hypothetical protein